MRRLMVLAAATLAAAAAGAFPAVEGLIGRLLPAHGGQIALEDWPAPKPGEPERWAYWTEGGKLRVAGNTPVAQASALGWYLRHEAKAAPFWEGFDAAALPAALPAAPGRVERTAPHRWRVYFNYCTLSYTAAFWDWARWEREIDLMALQGVNMPLQPIGLEGVWYRLLQRPEVGFSEAEAREFLVGPAYFAWQWMTNIERFGGPLPKAFIEDRVALGKKIVERERAFGMTPIQQGFTGFVPLRLREKFPQAAIKQQPPWCGSFAGSAQLDPLDPLFKTLAKGFYEEQKALFGAYGYYGTDPFHESAPPRPGEQYLADVGRAIYEAAVAADPKATLCMQSWSIRKPILHAIPKEHCLVLDIGGRWRGQKAFDGYPFVIGTIHNFGGRTRLFGDLAALARNPFAATKKAAPNCVGMGLFPEAIHNNPAYFALVFDLMWRDGPVDVEAWLDDYVRARYGAASPKAREAWGLLLGTVYRPGTHALHANVADAYLDRDPARLKAACDTFVAFGLDMDALCAAEPLLSFEQWVSDARALPGTPADKALYATNAACQVTQWGHNHNRPRIYDYAWKEWGGLIRDYYIPRWQRLHAALQKSLADGTQWGDEDKIAAKDYGRPALRATPFLDALADWEDAFIANPPAYAPKPGDPRAQALRILGKWGATLDALLAVNPMERLGAVRARLAERDVDKSLGAVVKRWAPKDCSNKEWRVWEVDVTKQFDANGAYAVTFTYLSGGSRLDIAEVALLQNGAEVSKDAHPGTTGDRNQANVYTLRFDDPILGAKLTLRAKVRTHGASTSNGLVQVRRAE